MYWHAKLSSKEVTCCVWQFLYQVAFKLELTWDFSQSAHLHINVLMLLLSSGDVTFRVKWLALIFRDMRIFESWMWSWIKFQDCLVMNRIYITDICKNYSLKSSHRIHACTVTGKDMLQTPINRLHQQKCNFTAGTSYSGASPSATTLARSTPLPHPAWPNHARGILLHRL